jgi:hypothetical protein
LGLFFVVGASLLACATSTEPESGSSTGAATDDPLLPADLTPADWNIETPADAPTPGTEPINVIITTDFKFSDIVDLLHAPYGADSPDTWREVQLGTGFDAMNPDDWRKLEQGGACISPESADIDGNGKAAQSVSLRVAGCFPGVLLEGESHVRAWESVKRRKSQQTQFDTRTVSTWYLAVSQEHLCNVSIGGHIRPWHCILPTGYKSLLATYKNNGFKVEAPTGGYDKGRDDFVDDLKTAAAVASGWIVDCKSIPRPASTADDGLKVNGLDRVPWDDKVTYCTVMNSKYRSD